MSDLKLPATLPANGNLPATYESAQKALAQCSRIDEVKNWADKAAALASYARQAKDHTLLNLAQRIQARAIRRAGELLKQIPPGDQATRFGQAGAHPPVITRSQAARDAGLSQHQAKQGLRLANIPEPEFNSAVESDSPPTVTELAARGIVPRPSPPEPLPIPADPRHVAEALTLLRKLAVFCETHDPSGVAHAPALDADLVRNLVITIDRWLDRFISNLPEERAA